MPPGAPTGANGRGQPGDPIKDALPYTDAAAFPLDSLPQWKTHDD